MIPAYKYNFKLAAKSKWPENVSNVLNALGIEKHSTDFTGFHFEVTQNGKSTAFDRLLKLDNAFEAFRINPYTISSLLSDQPFPTELQNSLLSVVMKVGRSIPFHKSIFFIEQDSWDKQSLDIEISESDIFRVELPRNGVVLSNDWWISGRQQHLSLMTLPKVQENSLRVPTAVESVVARMGHVIDRDVIFFPEKGEASFKYFLHEKDNNPLAQEFNNIASTLAQKGLLELNIGNELKDRVTGFSRKRIINSAFKGLKFRPINSKSAKGLLLYSHRSERNNFISLYFDFGSWSYQCAVWLHIQGPLWKYSLQLSYVNQFGQGEISTPEEFEKAISNVKNIIINSERFIEKIESKYEKAPVWYELYSR